MKIIVLLTLFISFVSYSQDSTAELVEKNEVKAEVLLTRYAVGFYFKKYRVRRFYGFDLNGFNALIAENQKVCLEFNYTGKESEREGLADLRLVTVKNYLLKNDIRPDRFEFTKTHPSKNFVGPKTDAACTIIIVSLDGCD